MRERAELAVGTAAFQQISQLIDRVERCLAGNPSLELRTTLNVGISVWVKGKSCDITGGRWDLSWESGRTLSGGSLGSPTIERVDRAATEKIRPGGGGWHVVSEQCLRAVAQWCQRWWRVRR